MSVAAVVVAVVLMLLICDLHGVIVAHAVRLWARRSPRAWSAYLLQRGDGRWSR